MIPVIASLPVVGQHHGDGAVYIAVALLKCKKVIHRTTYCRHCSVRDRCDLIIRCEDKKMRRYDMKDCRRTSRSNLTSTSIFADSTFKVVEAVMRGCTLDMVNVISTMQ